MLLALTPRKEYLMPSPEFVARRDAIFNATDEAASSLDGMRANFEAGGLAVDLPDGVIEVEAAGSPVSAVWLRTVARDDDPVLLYLHGGGYVAGSPRAHRPLAADLAMTTGLPVLILDYRLAPEDPFPAAQMDVMACYRWLRRERPGSIVLVGDSAGAGLSLTSLVALRASGDQLPDAVVLLSPWVDLSLSGESMRTNEPHDPLARRSGLSLFAAAYLNGIDPLAPAVSPLHADLSGLPPMLVQVGSHETLLDDARRLAERLEAASGDVTLDIWPEMVHVWQSLGRDIPEAIEALQGIAEWLAARGISPAAMG